MKAKNELRIFISYKRNRTPDHPLANYLFDALRHHYTVFIDQIMDVGVKWAQKIEEEINQADFFIPLLSEAAIDSEMVIGEINRAYNQQKETGKPIILPVRVQYDKPFSYPLNAYLDPINWTSWNSDHDNARLVLNIRTAIEGKTVLESCDTTDIAMSPTISETESVPISPIPSAQIHELESPEGTMHADSAYYVIRSEDYTIKQHMRRHGVTLTIKGPRQVGKSSMLMQAIAAAQEAGKEIVFLDFQLFNQSVLKDANVFYRQFCSWISRRLHLENRVDDFWDPYLSHSQNCTEYIESYVLQKISTALVLAMDEVDSVFDSDFRTDFFGMLRSWHNSRATSRTLERLDLALVTSTEPYQFIDNLNMSPFNVGEVIKLLDFTLAQVEELNRKHRNMLRKPDVGQLFELLHGHPFLTRRALFLIATQRLLPEVLFATAADPQGPFGDHLRSHLFRLHNKPELIQGLQQVIRRSTCTDEQIFFRLNGAGLVRREGGQVITRCALYDSFFRAAFNLP